MRHLSNIDTQLGLVPMGDFSNADGRGLAKAALASGLASCGLKHPFNKGKREACKKEKLQLYAAKIAAIDGVKGETSKEAKQIEALTGALNAAIAKPKPKPNTQERYSKPKVDAIVKNTTETAAAAAADEIAASSTAEEEGMSMGTKIAIGVGVLVVLVGGYMYMKKK